MPDGQPPNQAAYCLCSKERAIDDCTASQDLLDEDDQEYTEDPFPETGEDEGEALAAA